MSAPATPSYLLTTLCHIANGGSLTKGYMMEDTVPILLYTTFKNDQTGHYNSRISRLFKMATTTAGIRTVQTGHYDSRETFHIFQGQWSWSHNYLHAKDIDKNSHVNSEPSM